MTPRCTFCGQPATCISQGDAEDAPVIVACDACCPHTGEDECKPIGVASQDEIEEAGYGHGV